jgi:GT2 family glycosyltransferase
MVVTWNRKETLVRALESVIQQSYPNIEIVLVDNASTDGTQEAVREGFPIVQYIHLDKNIGCPCGRNVGFRQCKGEYIYCLDDDGWLDTQAIEKSVKAAESNMQAGVIMSKIIESQDGVITRISPADIDVPATLSAFSGGCSLIRASVLTKVGMYAEDFSRQAEEMDLAIRMLDIGYYCRFEPDSVMYHDPSPVGRDKRTFLYYTLRNTTKTALRYYPLKWVLQRLCSNIVHSVKYAFLLRIPGLPFTLFCDFCRDIFNLRGIRKPVSDKTMRLYDKLRRKPLIEIVDEETIYGWKE